MLPNTPSNIKLETCISHQMLTSKKIMCLFANQYEMQRLTLRKLEQVVRMYACTYKRRKIKNKAFATKNETSNKILKCLLYIVHKRTEC